MINIYHFSLLTTTHEVLIICDVFWYKTKTEALEETKILGRTEMNMAQLGDSNRVKEPNTVDSESLWRFLNNWHDLCFSDFLLGFLQWSVLQLILWNRETHCFLGIYHFRCFSCLAPCFQTLRGYFCFLSSSWIKYSTT